MLVLEALYSQAGLDDSLASNVLPLHDPFRGQEVPGLFSRHSFPGSMLVPALELVDDGIFALIRVLHALLMCEHIMSALDDHFRLV